MGALAVLILTAALPAYWGFTSASPIYTGLLAVASAFFGVINSGWREPGGGLLMSMVWGLIFSASVCTLGYVIGYGTARLAN
jgi:hypothetical protein